VKIYSLEETSRSSRVRSPTKVFIQLVGLIIFRYYTYVTVTLISPEVAPKCFRFALISSSVEPV
jgi:hypothetical protein